MSKVAKPLSIALGLGLLISFPAFGGVFKRYENPVADAVAWHGSVALAQILERSFVPAVIEELGPELREYTVLKLKVLRSEGKTVYANNAIVYAGFLGGNEIYGNSAAPPLAETTPGSTVMVFLAPSSPFEQVTGKITWIHNSTAIYPTVTNRSGDVIVKSKGVGSAFPLNQEAGSFLNATRTHVASLKNKSGK